MKRTGLFLGGLLTAAVSFSQEMITFETDRIDLGNIEKQGGAGKLEIPFTNTGKEILIVERASTGDGGTYADYPKEPIKPGGTGVITFVYARDNPGPHSRGLTVIAIEGRETVTKTLQVKYTIVYPPTEVIPDRPMIGTRELPFGESDTLEFSLRNGGIHPLYLSYPFYSSVNKEVLVVEMTALTTGGEPRKNADFYCEPGERFRIRVVVMNIYGSVVPVNHHLDFNFNNGQSFSMPLVINGTGVSPKAEIIQAGRYFHYEKGALTRLDEFDSSSGKMNRSYFFNAGDCLRETIRDSYSGTLNVIQYTNGKEVSRTHIPFPKGE